MAAKVHEVCSEAELQALRSSHSGLSVLLLWAPWHPPSVHLTKVMEALAKEHANVRVAKSNVDVCPDLATSLGADQVPYVVFLDPHGTSIDVVAGADPPKLVQKVKMHSSRPFDSDVSTSAGSSDAGGSEVELNERLKKLINHSPVMLFMKGSKVDPFCKFSKKAVALLNKYDVEYSTFDILKDEAVRQGLKDYSDWKTYPQLYVDGKLVGGIDIMEEMEAEGSLESAFPSAPLQVRLKALINKAPVTLFMKGDPDAPRCGFSRKMIDILNENTVKFDYFDILSDEEVRQGLKKYSNWPTYPQLYANGNLVGGLDIVQELVAEGSLLDELSGNGA